MPKVDPYTDKILGEWKQDKKNSKKNIFSYKRSATITLARDYALDWIDPETFKKKRVYGEVTLVEHKSINALNSNINYSRNLELTTKSVVEDVV